MPGPVSVTENASESPSSTTVSVTAPAGGNFTALSIVHYVGEARRLGKPVRLLIDPDAGHGPESVLGAEACLYLIEDAAHRHFGGGLSSVSPELRAFLRRNVRIDIDARR